MNATEQNTLPQQTEDYPQYWLGQLTMVSDMERSGKMTKAQMVSEVNRIIGAMRNHDVKKALRAERILRKESA